MALNSFRRNGEHVTFFLVMLSEPYLEDSSGDRMDWRQQDNQCGKDVNRPGGGGGPGTRVGTRMLSFAHYLRALPRLSLGRVP